MAPLFDSLQEQYTFWIFFLQSSKISQKVLRSSKYSLLTGRKPSSWLFFLGTQKRPDGRFLVPRTGLNGDPALFRRVLYQLSYLGGLIRRISQLPRFFKELVTLFLREFTLFSSFCA